MVSEAFNLYKLDGNTKYLEVNTLRDSEDVDLATNAVAFNVGNLKPGDCLYKVRHVILVGEKIDDGTFNILEHTPTQAIERQSKITSDGNAFIVEGSFYTEVIRCLALSPFHGHD